MDIHKPKPVHNLREFLSEVAVVLLGIVLALAGEQGLQALETRHKAHLIDEEMRQEVAGDDGPQILERIALAPCVDRALGDLRTALEQGADRQQVLSVADRFWTPRHTWDSVAFQAALSAGILAQLPVERVDAMSRFYALMPALEGANEREYRDAASLGAIARSGGPLSEAERGHLLGVVEILRRDNAEMVRFSSLGRVAMRQLGIRIADFRPLPGQEASIQNPQRVVDELEQQAMAKECVGELKGAMVAAW